MDQRVARSDYKNCAAFRVGRATIDPVSLEARYGNHTERLQPLALKTLIALASRTGSVVTREELIADCWGGRIVSDDVVNRAILLLRGVANRAGGFRIETIPRSGYRLVEDPVRRLDGRRAAIIVITIAVAAMIGFLATRPRAPSPPTVALLTFTSGADPVAKDIAAAATDSVSHMLLDNGQAFRLVRADSPAQGSRADLLVSGDVRRTGTTLQVVTQLRDRATGSLLLSRRYEVPDGDRDIAVQAGAQLSASLATTLGMMVLDRRHPLSPDKAAALLKHVALGYFDDDLLAAYALSRQVRAEAPASPMAQLALAIDSAFVLARLPPDQRLPAWQTARAAAAEASRLAPDFGDTALPRCLLSPPWAVAQCEDGLRAGLRRDPDAPFVPLFLSNILSRTGRNAEALEFARMAIGADRYNPNKIGQLERALLVEGQDGEADRLFAAGQRYWPTQGNFRWARIDGFLMRGDLAGARRAITQIPPGLDLLDRHRAESIFAAHGGADWAALKGHCLDAAGDRAVERICLVALRDAGDRATAFAILDRLYPERASGTAWLENPVAGRDPALASDGLAWLRDDSRFAMIAGRSGLLEYWRDGRPPDFCRKDALPLCRSKARD